ncbi:MAG: phosphatase PAP2 family protein [Bacteroidales bacterium]|nr:phosphatase PAP2 family protein [Bacteroidales bacterium]
MIEYLDNLDKELILWLNYDGGPWFDQLWYFVAGKFTWLPLYLFLLWLLYRQCKPLKFHGKHFVLILLITVLVVVLCDQIASGLIKHWVERPRPSRSDSGISDMIHIVNHYRGGHYGFVSSHASNTWGIALWFMLLWRKGGQFRPLKQGMGIIFTVLIAYSILNCYSRIYLGVHYPGDILGGLVVGTIVALFCYFVVYRYTKKWLKIDNSSSN